MRTRLLTALLLAGLWYPSLATAAPVRWTFDGVVNGFPGLAGPELAEFYSIGTPLTIVLNFDTVSTNLAGFSETSGLYWFHEGAAVTIGGQTYVGFAAFEVNCPAGNCGFGPPVVQEFFPLSSPLTIRLGFSNAPFCCGLLMGGPANLSVYSLFEVDMTFEVTSEDYTVMPEPATLLLMGAGLAAMAVRRRRRPRC